ncbi:protein TWIN LOV 1-like [Zingiber officinale]|uniref:protein TWIN LOV 1-like n=1 Tax=Zingiber officinale TaxID=94328 RepID=UPI001C4ABEE3|nr:protein TWIN LOV 1-like [Zingiber officinale]
MLAVLTAPAIGRRADSTSLPPLTSSAEPMDPPHRLLIEQSLPARYSEWVVETLDEIEGCFLITDPGIADHPIVFASHGFLVMSGYSIEEVLGRNGRIFQGPDTDRRSVMEIREAIREERTLQISLLNYRNDGTPHWILFHLFPVFRVEDIRVAHFVAVQVEIPMRSKCLRSYAEHRHGGGTGRLLVACRNECQSDYKLGCDTVVESFVDVDNGGLEVKESREASEQEKEKAHDAANIILSTLIHYSQLTGRVVSDKRCSEAGISAINSSLVISLGRIKQSFVLIDPRLPQMPIVYASDEFLSLSGYSRHEVLGCDCWFLNGPDTEADAIHQIRQSIQAERSCTIRLLNYRKDRSFFWNLHHISPVRNSSGRIAFYVSVQLDENTKSDDHGLSAPMRQLGVVGAVKVAVRSLSLCAGPSRLVS